MADAPCQILASVSVSPLVDLITMTLMPTSLYRSLSSSMPLIVLCVEKKNATGPCTHHVHAILHFKENVPKPTFAKWVNRWLCGQYNKDEGAVKHDFNSRVAVDLRTCYCIKDEYLTKHETSEHYVGIADFDLDAAAGTADLPDEEQQESLQKIKPDRVVNAVWINYSQKWTEFAPGERSIESAWCWYSSEKYTRYTVVF